MWLILPPHASHGTRLTPSPQPPHAPPRPPPAPRPRLLQPPPQPACAGVCFFGARHLSRVFVQKSRKLIDAAAACSRNLTLQSAGRWDRAGGGAAASESEDGDFSSLIAGWAPRVTCSATASNAPVLQLAPACHKRLLQQAAGPGRSACPAICRSCWCRSLRSRSRQKLPMISCSSRK